MYGLDGNFNALQWAETVGFDKVTPKDQEQLIKDGFYTKDGGRIYTPEEQTSLDTPCTSTRASTVDMRV